MGFGAASPFAKAEDGDRFLGAVDQVVQDTGTPIRYGVTLVHLQDDYWKGMAYGIVDEVQKSGGKVVQVSIAGKYGNVTEQFAQIDAMMTKGIDVLVLGASSYDGFDPILAEGQGERDQDHRRRHTRQQQAAGLGRVVQRFRHRQEDGRAAVREEAADKFTIIGLPGPAGAEWSKLRVWTG